MSLPAVFLDRDGVMVRDNGYVHRVEDLALLPGVVPGLRRFQQAGYLLVVVTNQSGIARGLFTEDDYQVFTLALSQRLAAAGVKLDAVLHCPHFPDAAVARYAVSCECRKPQPGMLMQAIRERAINPAASLMVGDRASDMQAGRAAGVGRCYLIGNDESAKDGADGIFTTLEDCALRHLSSQLPSSPCP